MAKLGFFWRTGAKMSSMARLRRRLMLEQDSVRLVWLTDLYLLRVRKIQDLNILVVPGMMGSPLGEDYRFPRLVTVSAAQRMLQLLGDKQAVETIREASGEKRVRGTPNDGFDVYRGTAADALRFHGLQQNRGLHVAA